jgi:uncharacterized protein GlcG (DUF336 family)
VVPRGVRHGRRGRHPPNFLSFAGGVPIKVGDEIVGAMGVSGAAPSAIDEKCANAGLEKIKTRAN